VTAFPLASHTMKQAAPSSIDQGGGKRRGEGIGLRVRLWIRASNRHAFGDEGILWRPSVHRVAIGALGKCNSVGSARSISMLVETSLFVLGHWNNNFVNGASTSHRRRRAELMRFGTRGAQRQQLMPCSLKTVLPKPLSCLGLPDSP
jgi:hypothetical protein